MRPGWKRSGRFLFGRTERGYTIQGIYHARLSPHARDNHVALSPLGYCDGGGLPGPPPHERFPG